MEKENLVIVIVALVAIVGIVALVLSAGGTGKTASFSGISANGQATALNCYATSTGRQCDWGDGTHCVYNDGSASYCWKGGSSAN